MLLNALIHIKYVIMQMDSNYSWQAWHIDKKSNIKFVLNEKAIVSHRCSELEFSSTQQITIVCWKNQSVEVNLFIVL